MCQEGVSADHNDKKMFPQKISKNEAVLLLILIALCWQELMSSTTTKIRKGFLYSFLTVVVIFLVAIIYLWFHFLVEIEYDSGLTLGQIDCLAIWLVNRLVSTIL